MKKIILLLISIILLGACNDTNISSNKSDYIFEKIQASIKPCSGCVDENDLNMTVGSNYKDCKFEIEETPIFGSDKKRQAYVCWYHSNGNGDDSNIKSFNTRVMVTNDSTMKEEITPEFANNQSVYYAQVDLVFKDKSFSPAGWKFLYDAKKDLLIRPTDYNQGNMGAN